MGHLTFGVELEFCLATLPQGARDPEPHDPRQIYSISDANAISILDDNQTFHPANLHYFQKQLQNDIVQKHLAETLTSAGFPSIINVDLQRQADEVAHGAPEVPIYKSWQVIIEPSICVPGEKNTLGVTEYEWYRMEVISPAMIFSPQAIRQVKKVCKLIHRKYRTLTNEWCGLHVQVGQGLNGLPDYAIKNLAAMIWTFEDRLDLLHPQYRTNDEACNSLYNSAPLASELDFETDKPLLLREQLDRILECRTGNQVIDLVNDECPCYGHAYNLWNLRSEFRWCGKRIIEFRQHEGTLDAKRIENWIKVCVDLVGFALQVQLDCLEDFLRSAVDDEEYSVENLLLSIGLPR
jgi:hypothetical protein